MDRWITFGMWIIFCLFHLKLRNRTTHKNGLTMQIHILAQADVTNTVRLQQMLACKVVHTHTHAHTITHTFFHHGCCALSNNIRWQGGVSGIIRITHPLYSSLCVSSSLTGCASSLTPPSSLNTPTSDTHAHTLTPPYK